MERKLTDHRYDWCQRGYDDGDNRRHKENRDRNLADGLEHLIVVIGGMCVRGGEGGVNKLDDE